jgi:hypothetical protein
MGLFPNLVYIVLFMNIFILSLLPDVFVCWEFREFFPGEEKVILFAVI